jgi:hypothetical protein
LKVAELIYEALRRISFVMDFLLKKHLMISHSWNPDSMEVMIDLVEKQAQAEASIKPEGDTEDVNGNKGSNRL